MQTRMQITKVLILMYFLCFKQIFGSSKMYILSHSGLGVCLCSKALILFLLIHCFMLLQLFVGVFVVFCFVMYILAYFLVLTRKSWLLFFTVKPVLSGHSKRRQKMVSKTDYYLMQVKSIAECSNTFDLY